MIGYSEEEIINEISFEDLFAQNSPLEIDLISNKSLTENLYLEQDFKSKNGNIISVGLTTSFGSQNIDIYVIKTMCYFL